MKKLILLALVSASALDPGNALLAQRATPQGFIGGVVRSSNGPEAGVWVIAETKDLPTNFIKIVVTDDQGRYLVPELPASLEENQKVADRVAACSLLLTRVVCGATTSGGGGPPPPEPGEGPGGSGGSSAETFKPKLDMAGSSVSGSTGPSIRIRRVVPAVTKTSENPVATRLSSSRALPS